MNKQEVIEKIKNIDAVESFMSETIWVKRNDVLALAYQLDEPEKPVVPQFVADWYENNEDDFEFNLYTLCLDYNNCEVDKKLSDWFCDKHNKPLETLVNMHQFGYEVEKEKLYTARLRLVSDKKYSFINKQKKYNKLFISSLDDLEGRVRCHFTQEELKELNVWGNPAFEIKEVEE
ncbi:DUF1642 domain-containing protein [Streptococcus sp.]